MTNLIQKIHHLAKKSPLFHLYKKSYFPSDENQIVTFEGVKKFLKENLFEDFKPDFLKHLEDLDVEQISLFLVKNILFIVLGIRYRVFLTLNSILGLKMTIDVQANISSFERINLINHFKVP
jgi:hypothetical protein